MSELLFTILMFYMLIAAFILPSFINHLECCSCSDFSLLDLILLIVYFPIVFVLYFGELIIDFLNSVKPFKHNKEDL